MCPPAARLALCLLLALFASSRGLTFFMNSTSDGEYCGHLQCVASINQTGNFPFMTLAIYNDTDDQDKAILASVSELDPHVHLGHNVSDLINATGGVSQDQDGVLVEIRLELDCRNGSLVCELALMNTTADSDVFSRAVLP